jgi:hypothetical protein
MDLTTTPHNYCINNYGGLVDRADFKNKKKNNC